MKPKRVFKTPADFQGCVGQVIGKSEPLSISREAVETFCASVGNREWIHWDAQRCISAGLGGVIAPGFMMPALFSKAFFDLFEIEGFASILFSGTERMRLLAPVPVPGDIFFEIAIDRVEQRNTGIAVFYGVKWFLVSKSQPAGVGVFVIRYQ